MPLSSLLQKAAAAVNKVAVRVSMTISRDYSRSNAMAMDDVVVLMVPRDAPGSTVIALALAAREFEWEDHDVTLVPENPDHFDLLRLRPASAGSRNKFQICAGTYGAVA